MSDLKDRKDHKDHKDHKNLKASHTFSAANSADATNATNAFPFIWEIQETPQMSNSHLIGARNVEWKLKRKKVECRDEKEAKAKIIELTKNYADVKADYIRLTERSTEAEEILFRTKFCFTDDRYRQYRRYFLHKPSNGLIALMVTDMGANLSSTSKFKFNK